MQLKVTTLVQIKHGKHVRGNSKHLASLATLDVNCEYGYENIALPVPVAHKDVTNFKLDHPLR